MEKASQYQKLLFISDVHLGGFNESRNAAIERSFVHLVEYCLEREFKLFILGDLFDYWMEYPSYVPGVGAMARDILGEYNRALGPTLYITGNHDNWSRGYFESIGFRVVRDYTHLQLDGEKALLLHGDGIVDENGAVKRPLLHRLLRNKSFIKLYQWLLPPGAGLAIMKRFSRFTRWLESSRLEAETLNKWAETRLRQKEEDYIVCGHDHNPRVRNFPFGTYLNLGTFYKHRTLARYTNGTLELVAWNEDARELNSYYPSGENSSYEQE